MRLSYLNYFEVQSNKKSLTWTTPRNQEIEPCMESLPKVMMILLVSTWLYLKQGWLKPKRRNYLILFWVSFWLQGAPFDSCLRLAMLPALILSDLDDFLSPLVALSGIIVIYFSWFLNVPILFFSFRCSNRMGL